MYTTCLFCHSSLGRNESFELFPVGRRIAYDAAKGRLWVVCGKCERWNLSPLEERWETIEHAERAYRDTKKRVATDNVGLARLRDGTDLIRIGAPLRPEFAAWRYGRHFARRRRNRVLLGSAAVVVGGSLAAFTYTTYAGSILGISTGLITWGNLGQTIYSSLLRRSQRITLTANDGVRINVTGANFQRIIVAVDSEEKQQEPGITLYCARKGDERPRLMKEVRSGGTVVRFEDKSEIITGTRALEALAKVLAVSNRLTGQQSHVSNAVLLVESAGSPQRLLQSLPMHDYRPSYSSETKTRGMAPIQFMPAHARLALEMSLHEESERRAMEGELEELERRWKEAEEIAAIADSLTLSAATHARLDALKDKSPDLKGQNTAEAD